MSASLAAPMELYMLVKDPGLIRRLMDSKEPKVSARSLASHVWPGKSHSYMNRILAGDVSSVSVDTAAKISYKLGVPVDILFVPRVAGSTGQTDGRKAS